MSQDRTFVPGMENTPSNANGSLSSFYSRSAANSIGNSPKGTVVPGMSAQNGGASNQFHSTNTPSPVQQARETAQGMPVVGFLYSISNQGIPEYWPIMLGYNRIGRNADNEVVLNEQTISGIHAGLMIQKKRNTGEVVAVIRLEEGRTGVLVNGEEVDLRFSSECKNGDILTIGSNYEMILILIQAEMAGLRIAENFIPVEAAVVEEEPVVEPPKRPGFNPYNNRGTMAQDGAPSFDNPGGTRFM